MNDSTARRAVEPRAASEETVRGVQEGLASTLHSVRDLNVRLIDMARANTEAAFDFAGEIAAANAPSDLVQAWSAHANRQFDMLTKQAGELASLGEKLGCTSAESLRQAFKE
jgi:hypothetical protein